MEQNTSVSVGRRGKKPGFILELKNAGKLCPACASKTDSPTFSNKDLCDDCKAVYKAEAKQKYLADRKIKKEEKQKASIARAAHAREVLAGMIASGNNPFVGRKARKVKLPKAKKEKTVYAYEKSKRISNPMDAAIATLKTQRQGHIDAITEHTAKVKEIDSAIATLKKL